ncbi:hypothetical protein C7960_0742 [Methanohalophilus euhalobius]|uniref:Uncharacterized protein n=1 Tax=Methanohalophilus euhalobius TaxID=51203 RepID=A0A285GAX9_9EURY|nr:hypothetical protein C7960_0742 [Methanohalophilus euhalobius]SNY20729.1 hypothetical protein SAMN06295989_11161 [Methanohalophilus euhalobius]
MFDINYSRQAAKFLRSLDNTDLSRMLKKLKN